MKTITKALQHHEGCPAPDHEPERVETYEVRQPDGGQALVERCCTCGAQRVERDHLRSRLEPGSPEWAAAWESDPQRIVEGLTPAERRDPSCNPLHPYASASMRKATAADTHARGES
jgi:hypothetical protein